MTQEQKKFIERVGALAAADMQKSGVLASLTIAQAILESGWGKSGLTVKGNALFGIKAGTSWTGAVYSGKTQECYDGVTFTTVTGLFRAYGSWGGKASPIIPTCFRAMPAIKRSSGSGTIKPRAGQSPRRAMRPTRSMRTNWFKSSKHTP